MLRHMGLKASADKINKAVFEVLKEGKYVTKDLGGNSSTSEYTKAIIDNIK